MLLLLLLFLSSPVLALASCLPTEPRRLQSRRAAGSQSEKPCKRRGNRTAAQTLNCALLARHAQFDAGETNTGRAASRSLAHSQARTCASRPRALRLCRTVEPKD